MCIEQIKNKKVVWKENPSKYEYLRVSDIVGCSANYLGGLGKSCKIIGYTKSEYNGDSTYSKIIFWLKDYDRGMPNENEVYGNQPKEYKPSEAIDTKEILRSIDNG
jgi:hypothetical protein